jgi:uncharacterized SAM-binding protein YcdF (DUF218 family)
VIRAAVARALALPLEVADPPHPADAIVILGAPLRDGALSEVVEERVAAGFALWRDGLAPIVCVTGRGEADAMAARLCELGVPAQELRIEREARTTLQNAMYTAKLLGEARTILLVTQPFHLRRARRLFRAAGFENVRAHRISDSLQDRAPARALPWLVREYAAWLRWFFRRGSSAALRRRRAAPGA